MNKNDKFHGGITPPECENNVNELNEEQLESVAGGWWEVGTISGYKDDYCETCKKTTSHSFQYASELNPWDQKKICSVCNTWIMVAKGRTVF